jgi:hypothetical protein
MYGYKKKIVLLTFSISLLIFFSAIKPAMSSYEFKVQPGAFMEYTVTEARQGDNEGFLWWEVLNNGTYLPINITSGSKFRADVTEANETHVLGNITLLSGLKTAKKSLDYIYPNTKVGIPLVRQVTEKVEYQQMSLGSNQKLQGNSFTTEWEWNWGNGILKQEEKLNIISGWIEFFAYIFLVNETEEEIFSMTRSSPVTPGFELSTIAFPILIVGIVIRNRVNKKKN